MDALNDFSKGQQSDFSKLIQSKNTYLQAINFRPFTEFGASNTSLVTVRGNECGVNFPNIINIFKLRLNILRPATYTDTINLTISGFSWADTITNLTINSSTDIAAIYALIIALPNYNVKYKVAYKDDYLVFYQIPTVTGCEANVESLTVNVTQNTAPGIQNTLVYVDQSNANSAIKVAFIPNIADPLIPIGYTTILEDIYLFVAVNNPAYTDIYPTGSGVPSNDDYSEPGFIFKLQYDESSNTTTLTLIYAAYLNFTKYAPIAPSAAIGRYESDKIQRIYWSDFYNKVRTLNVADPQLMALNPVLAGVTPSVGFDIPIMTNIITGSLNSGTYELCYRLKQTLGAITNYSTLSNMVHLAAPSITDFKAYEGSVPGTNSNKGIRFKVSNLDNAYDRVEFIVTFRDSKSNICKVYSLSEVNIPTSGMLNVDVTSLATATEILLTEFLAIQSSFTHAKTVDTKDNRLFWGNVKVKQGSLPSWDSRAFRAFTSGGNDIKVINSGVPTTYTLAQATNISINPETSDCINEYYDTSGGFGTDACYYKPNTSILGGAGTNISYEFGTYSTELNDLGRTGNSDDGAMTYNPAPFSNVNGYSDTINLLSPALTNDSTNQKYTQDALFNLKSPYRSTILRGLQHEEIYRAGIEFFDLEGVPLFVKWIADIKMPSYGDPNPNPDRHALAAGVTDFRLSYANTYDAFSRPAQTFGQTLYVKFNVDVTALKDIVSGYRIVRMERSSTANKTILGMGILTSTFVKDTDYTITDSYLPANFYAQADPFPSMGGSRNIPFHPYPRQRECEQMNCDGTSTGIHINSKKVKTFDCFDFQVSGGVSYGAGDKIFIRSRLKSINYRTNYTSRNQGYQTSPGTSNTVLDDWLSNDYIVGTLGGTTYYPEYVAPGWGAVTGTNFQTGYDTFLQPYYLHMYLDDTTYGSFSTVKTSNYSRPIDAASFVFGNDRVTVGSTGQTFNNWGRAFRNKSGATAAPTSYDTKKTCYGNRTVAIGLVGGNEYYDTDFGCNINGGSANTNNKLIALYYKPNNNQYGGATYSSRAGNEYIPWGSYIPVRRDNTVLTNNLSLGINVLGGDVYLSYWDMQKAEKAVSQGPQYRYHSQSPNGGNLHPGSFLGAATDAAEYQVSVSYFFPCTNEANVEMRYGKHVNTSLTSDTYAGEDENYYPTYHSNESNIVKYFSKPLDFVETDKWINRIFYSDIKYNNETADSWQVYKTNNFYDVEGNYGSINALVAFKENLYYIQERGFGILYINPMTAISGSNNIPVILGLGSTIQRHNYIKLDVGTMHQWSVYRSPDNIAFIDSRHKTLYMYNGQSLEPTSDIKGERNFFVKRFHPDLILRDNPIIGAGVHTTYDFYHKEFLFTFNNFLSGDSIYNPEQYTLAYSEAINSFSSLYTFTPTIYFNNNRYILSTSGNSIYIHNYGTYGNFYGSVNPAYLKVLVNDNPLYTKVFDNLVLATESVYNTTEWIDENVTPTSNTVPYSLAINQLSDTFNSVRCYNEYQNTDWTPLAVGTNLVRKEQSWNLAIPRNMVNYDTLIPSTNTIFDPAILTKTDFGERLRDKYLVVDLKYDNTNNNRFIVHNLKTKYRISAR